MTEPAATWQGTFTVHAYEMDARGRLSLPGLCNWLQEAAGRHATSLGWSIHELMAQGRTWVLSRLSLRLAAHPPFDTNVTVTTWPSGVQRLYSLRDFRLTDGDGDEVAVATTGWLLLDLSKRRPLRPPPEVDAVSRRSPGRALDDRFERLPEPPPGTSDDVPAAVPWSAIDINGHANNVAVIEWLLAATPHALASAASLTSLEVEFRSEARCGDLLRASASTGDGDTDTLVHGLRHGQDGTEVARGRTRWRRDPDPRPETTRRRRSDREWE